MLLQHRMSLAVNIIQLARSHWSLVEHKHKIFKGRNKIPSQYIVLQMRRRLEALRPGNRSSSSQARLKYWLRVNLLKWVSWPPAKARIRFENYLKNIRLLCQPDTMNRFSYGFGKALIGQTTVLNQYVSKGLSVSFQSKARKCVRIHSSYGMEHFVYCDHNYRSIDRASGWIPQSQDRTETETTII